jgi:hypothetical protein
VSLSSLWRDNLMTQTHWFVFHRNSSSQVCSDYKIITQILQRIFRCQVSKALYHSSHPWHSISVQGAIDYNFWLMATSRSACLGLLRLVGFLLMPDDVLLVLFKLVQLQWHNVTHVKMCTHWWCGTVSLTYLSAQCSFNQLEHLHYWVENIYYYSMMTEWFLKCQGESNLRGGFSLIFCISTFPWRADCVFMWFLMDLGWVLR